MSYMMQADGEPTNEQRAEWAKEAVSRFTQVTWLGRTFDDLEDGDREDAIKDLIVDLLHLAHQAGIPDLEELMRFALVDFRNEVEDEIKAP